MASPKEPKTSTYNMPKKNSPPEPVKKEENKKNK